MNARITSTTHWFSGRALVWGAAALVPFLITLVAVLIDGTDGPLPIDHAWAGVMESIRVPPLTTIGVALNTLGGTTVSIAIIVLALVWLLYHRLPWALLTVVAASGVTVALTQACKWWISRPRPESMIVESDFGSFPSGHSATTVMLMAVFALLIRKHWFTVLAVVYSLTMMLSRNYLGAHWLTDVIAGASIGLAVTLLVWAFTGNRVRRELRRAANRAPGTHRRVFRSRS